MKPAATSMERVLTTLGHREPDRVPLFLLLSLHGARELGLPHPGVLPLGAPRGGRPVAAAGQIRPRLLLRALLCRHRDGSLGRRDALLRGRAAERGAADRHPRRADRRPGAAARGGMRALAASAGRHFGIARESRGRGPGDRRGDLAVLAAGDATGLRPLPGLADRGAGSHRAPVAYQPGILRGMGQRAASGGRHRDLLLRPAGVAHHHASRGISRRPAGGSPSARWRASRGRQPRTWLRAVACRWPICWRKPGRPPSG